MSDDIEHWKKMAANLGIQRNLRAEKQTRIAKQLDWNAVLTGKLISGSYNHKLTLNSLLNQYKAVEIGNQDELAVFNITVRQLFDSATGNSFKAILDNTTASYTS